MMAREVTRSLKWELSPEVEPKPLEIPRDAALSETSFVETPAEALPVPEKPVGSLGEALIATGAAPTFDKSIELPDEERPLFEPDLTTSLEPVEAVVTEPETTEDFDWARPPEEEASYPARATSYLFSEEHPGRRLASIIALTIVVVLTLLTVWWAVPRFTSGTNIEPTADYIAGKQLAHKSGATAGGLISGEVKAASAGLVFVRDIRTQVTPGHVFVTIYLSAPVQFQTQPAPDHIYVDLHGVQLSPLMKATTVDPAGPIAQFKLTPTDEPGVIRLGMLLDAPCTFLVSVTNDPQAIVLDVQPQKGIRPGR
jgi:hypothetical protein